MTTRRPPADADARPTVDPDAARTAVETVPDPELPPVTVGMLGMLHDLRIEGGTVEVELLPTFSGCPATEMIAQDVTRALEAVAGVEQVHVRFRYDPPWTPDRIDDEGRERLREFGIAPPGGRVPGAAPPAGRPTLPVAPTGGPPGGAARVGTAEHRPCPYCGSDDTERESSFGPTPCRDVRFCHGCHQPFEAFKSLGRAAG